MSDGVICGECRYWNKKSVYVNSDEGECMKARDEACDLFYVSDDIQPYDPHMVTKFNFGCVCGEANDKLKGPYVKAWKCASCKKELTWAEKMDSHGTCPYCGAMSKGTIVETIEFSARGYCHE